MLAKIRVSSLRLETSVLTRCEGTIDRVILSPFFVGFTRFASQSVVSFVALFVVPLLDRTISTKSKNG